VVQLEATGNPGQDAQRYVPESRFGNWFLSTDTWTKHVLERALNDLERLIKNRKSTYPVVVDVGCGWGQSLRLLTDRFSPQRLIGIDINPHMLSASAAFAAANNIAGEFKQGSSSDLPLPDNSVDLVFCHQTFHHLIDQEGAVREFSRVLKPDGLLLFAESTREYINSWMIRLLFRHPMEVQKSAAEYLQMLREAGFDIPPEAVSYPYLWWSRADLGIRERWFGMTPPREHAETLVNAVAVRRR
jgi:ubiquinone/menaquinone biosynthesis C-methylase UbiE